MINIEKLYFATNQGLDIIKWVYPQAETGKKFRTREGADDDPSSMLYKRKSDKYGDIWGVTDFGDDGWKNPIDCYMKARNKSQAEFFECLQEIAEHFQCDATVDRKKNVPRIEKRPALPDEKNGTRKWEYKEKASAEDLAAMGRTIKLQDLSALNWHAAKWISSTKDGQTTIKYSTENYPIFIRERLLPNGSKNYKIYEPLNADKAYRFSYYPAGSCPEGYINGLYELSIAYKNYNDKQRQAFYADEKNRDKKYTEQKFYAAAICSGDRDALCCHSLGMFPIWFNSETYRIEKKDLNEIRKYVTDIYNIPDIDTTGIRMGRELALRFVDVKTIWLPTSLTTFRDHRGKPRKDFHDWVDLHPTISEFDDLKKRAQCAKFWSVDEKKGASIDAANLHYFLSLNGFATYVDEFNREDFQLIRIEGYEVKRVFPRDIRQFLRNWVIKNVNDHNVLNLILNSTRISTLGLEGMNLKELNFSHCSVNAQTIFFQNACVTITNNEFIVQKRDEYKGESHVWSDAVINHHFRQCEDFFKVERSSNEKGEPVFTLYINKVGSNLMGYMMNASRLHWRKEMETRFQSAAERKAYAAQHKFDLQGEGLTELEKQEQVQCFLNKVFVAGYMLHAYKDPSKPWAAFAMDDLVGSDGQRNGGSGKSLFFKALQCLLPTVVISGKDPKIFDNNHTFERVNQKTRMVVVSDCARTLDIERFYDRITEDFTVNPKNKPIYTLPFEISPKLAFTTNFVPSNIDPSSARRMLYMTFSDYYHEATDENDYLESRKVSDDFGKNLLPPQASENEWNADVNFLLQCLKFYLTLSAENIKILPPMKNIIIRKNIALMGDNFIEWATERYSQEGGNLNKLLVKEIEFDFCRKSTNMANLTMTTFMKKLRAFVDYAPWIKEINPEDMCNDNRGRIREKEGSRRYLIYLRSMDFIF